MKKIIAKILIFTLIISAIPFYNLNVSASENFEITTTNELIGITSEKELTNEINKEIEEQIESNDIIDFQLEVKSIENDEIQITSNYQDDVISVDFDIEMNPISGNMNMFATVEEDGELHKEDYTIVIEENEGDIVPVFINKNTGEEYRVDSSELQASIIPYVIYVLGGLVVKAVVKKVGQKIVLQIGKKEFIAKSKDVAQKALVNFTTQTIKVGTKEVSITKDRMEHILTRHHPQYWDGSTASSKEQSFFDPDMTINDIKDIIASGVRDSKNEIESNLKKNKDSEIYTTVNKVKYKIVVSNAGKIRTCFPQG